MSGECYRETRLKKITNSIIIGALVILLAGISASQETIWPNGYNISTSYQLSQYEFAVDDTITVTRMAANYEDFDLANLYLEDNLPQSFIVLASTLEIDNSPVDYFHAGPVLSSIVAGFNTFRWAIDVPSPDSSYDRRLHPGETLILEYIVVCHLPGEYALPFHTICGYGDSTGIFSTADSISVTVLPAVGIDDDRSPIPSETVISTAYPNPFNSSVDIKVGYPFVSNQEVNLIVYNMLGQKVEVKTIIPGERGIISWHPSQRLTSGIYMYVISFENYHAGGKMTLLK
jgi:hypothetical protein